MKYPVPALMETELGTERRCLACGEWWPLDEEFFYRKSNGFRGFVALCKACMSERQGHTRTDAGRKVDRPTVHHLAAQGIAPKDIARRMGCARETVYRILAAA